MSKILQNFAIDRNANPLTLQQHKLLLPYLDALLFYLKAKFNHTNISF